MTHEEPVAELVLMPERSTGKKVGSLQTGDLLHNFAEGCINWMKNLNSLQREGMIQGRNWRAVTCCKTPLDGMVILHDGGSGLW